MACASSFRLLAPPSFCSSTAAKHFAFRVVAPSRTTRARASLPICAHNSGGSKRSRIFLLRSSTSPSDEEHPFHTMLDQCGNSRDAGSGAGFCMAMASLKTIGMASAPQAVSRKNHEFLITIDSKRHGHRKRTRRNLVQPSRKNSRGRRKDHAGAYRTRQNRFGRIGGVMQHAGHCLSLISK